MVPWGLVAFLIGIAYGALKPGKQDKTALLREGIWMGLIVGIILAVLGVLVGYPALGLVGFVGAVVEAIILSLLFILGVWIGDLITGARRHAV
jgi:uncharacterized membrane protein YadS